MLGWEEISKARGQLASDDEFHQVFVSYTLLIAFDSDLECPVAVYNFGIKFLVDIAQQPDSSGNPSDWLPSRGSA